MEGGHLARIAPLSGVGAAVLIALGVVVGSTEDFLDSPGSLAESYVEHSDRILAGSQIGVIGAVLLIVFAATLSSALRRAGDSGRASAVVLGGGTAAGALWLAGFIVQAAGALRADEDDYLDFSSAATLNDLATLLGFAAAPVAAAAMVAGTAVVGLRISGVMPLWFAVVSVVLAVALLILPINWAATAGLLVWLIVVGIVLSIRPVLAVPYDEDETLPYDEDETLPYDEDETLPYDEDEPAPAEDEPTPSEEDETTRAE